MATESTAEIAVELVTLCKQGKHEEAIARFYSPEIISYEAMNPAEPARGLDAIKAKVEWWSNNMTVHSAVVQGPFGHGDQFAVRFLYNVTDKSTEKTSDIDEIAVYTVRDGKIVEERFFY
jgi:hypothetical protein